MARDAQRQQQIIDAFEALQTDFRASNPDRAPDVPPLQDGSREFPPSDAQLVESWIYVVLNLDGVGAQSRRWGRSLRDELLRTPEASADPAFHVRESRIEPDLRKRLSRYPGFDRDAGTLVRWLAAGRPDEPTQRWTATSGPDAAHLAREWRRVIPGLRGLKAWRFLEQLGYPVMAPEAPVRRLLFRFGEIEEQARTSEADGAKLTSALQALSSLTGITLPSLRLLLRWTTRPQVAYQGGGWCESNPRCGDCPLSAGCMFARFRRVESKGDTGTGPADTAGRELADRLKNRPLEDLSDAEILALVIRGGRGDTRAVETASDLIHRIGELPELEKSDVTELAAKKGVGRGTARQIKAALELGRRVSTRSLREGSKIQGSEDVWEAFRERFRHISQEHFIVLLLDTKNRFITHRIVSRGTLDSSAAHPREVFREAIRASASAVILMHNHPSGDPQPSPEDRAVTRQLVEAGSILGIRVLDHIILGARTYTSFRDRGEM